MKRFLLFCLMCVCGYFGFVLAGRFTRANVAPYKALENFSKVLQYTEANYVQPVSSDDLMEGAIRGMMQTLDPHSSYLPPKLYKEMKVETSGRFGGVGIEVTIKDEMITVVTPIDDTPAYEAKIKAGDIIVEINGKSTRNLTLPEAVNLMRGKIGDYVNLVMRRKGVPHPMAYKLRRSQIKVASVRGVRLQDDIGYVRISSFAERTGQDLAKVIEKFEKEKPLRGVLLDLRGNPGGLLDQAVRVVNVFVDSGPVVYTIGRDRSKKTVEQAQKGLKKTDAPVVVLVDGSSASASEIVAGALQDYGRAVIAGQQTFGKGSVQTIIPMADGAGLKLTIARYYTPSGRSIQVRGITPDVTLENIDPKLVSDARERNRSIREADLEGHFENEADVHAPAPEKPVADDKKDDKKKGKDAVAPVLTFEDRVKTDYMIEQARGILKTMSVVRGGLKSPSFKLDEEKSAAKASNEGVL